MNPSEIIKIIDWHKDIPIIIVYEPSLPTIETVNNNWKYIQKITEGKKFHIINDISQAPTPNRELRRAVKDTFAEMEPFVISSQVFTGESFLIRIALKFIASSMGMKNFNVVESIDAAISSIKSEY